MSLIKHLVGRIISFALLVAFELFVFVVIGMMVNQEDKDNNLQTNFGLLFQAAIYGEY